MRRRGASRKPRKLAVNGQWLQGELRDVAEDVAQAWKASVAQRDAEEAAKEEAELAASVAGGETGSVGDADAAAAASGADGSLITECSPVTANHPAVLEDR